MVVYALARADKEEKSPQSEAELAAYFHLNRLGSRVVGRNWRSGHYQGDIDLFVDCSYRMGGRDAMLCRCRHTSAGGLSETGLKKTSRRLYR